MDAAVKTAAPDVALTISYDLYGAMALADLLHSSGDALWQLLDVNDPIKPGPQEEFLLHTEVQLGGERHSIGALVALMQDARFMNVGDGEYGRLEALAHWLGQSTNLQRYLMTAHGSVSGTEKLRTDRKRQKYGTTWRATAFGERKPKQDQFQPADLDSLRDDLLVCAAELGQSISNFKDWPDVLNKKRHQCYKDVETLLLHGLGETRRPDNDVTLWDYVSSIASLYKSALAQQVLDGTWRRTACLYWRLLHVSFDGPAFWGQAHHVTDMLGRRQVLEKGLDAVRDILEVQYPLGNEVYRDEHGSVFVVPKVDGLLNLKDEQSTTLKALLEVAFDTEGIRGELVPESKLSAPCKGKEINLAKVLQARRRENAPQPDIAARWWAKGQRPENAEICTVCGWRPVGYIESGLEPWVTSQKAKDRNVCGICLHRRGRRARDWAHNAKANEEKIGSFERTIWTDEVADDNGRFALVVGCFNLEGWLDGKLIPTMLKSPSFARIRRCWDTTRQFWLDLVGSRDGKPPELEKIIVPHSLRLCINPANGTEFNKALGPYHVYDWPLRGGVSLSVVWVPNDKGGGYFLTADNLWYLAGPEQLAFPEEALKDDARLLYEFSRVINGQRGVTLLEPSGYGRPAKVKVKVRLSREGAVTWHPDSAYTPYIPILAEPATFMALVPADKALEVAKAIKAKYDREMARVRDRLPLHLGIIFAPRRTPLRAVLEAGRAMLEMPAEWEEWRVTAAGRKATFSRNGQSFDWEYPAKMGDNKTDDVWYPHLLLYEPNERLEEKKQRGMVPQGEEPELKKQDGDFVFMSDFTDTVYIRPSRFDFEFLDTTARRFEIRYDDDGRRPRRTRPFLLDDLDRLETLWAEMCNLEKSQRYQVISAIETTREAWFGSDSDCKSRADTVFRQFVRDTLAGAAWPKERTWKAIRQDGIDKRLENAGVSGELTDFAELHMQIMKE